MVDTYICRKNGEFIDTRVHDYDYLRVINIPRPFIDPVAKRIIRAHNAVISPAENE